MSKSSAIEFLLGGRGSLYLNSSSFSQISFKTSDFCPGDTLSKVYKVSEIKGAFSSTTLFGIFKFYLFSFIIV